LRSADHCHHSQGIKSPPRNPLKACQNLACAL
jgi:hypothetical protein